MPLKVLGANPDPVKNSKILPNSARPATYRLEKLGRFPNVDVGLLSLRAISSLWYASTALHRAFDHKWRYARLGVNDHEEYVKHNHVKRKRAC